MKNGNSCKGSDKPHGFEHEIYDVTLYPPFGSSRKVYRNVSPVDLSSLGDVIDFETTEGEVIFSTLPYLLVVRQVKR